MTVSENPVQRRFIRPADYYSAATPPSLLPNWATFGCGAAATIVLILVFVGGAVLSGGGMATFMDFAIGMSLSEMKAMYEPAVSAEQKRTLEAEINTLRAHLRQERLAIPAIQPFLELVRDVSADKKVTAPEAANMEKAVQFINRKAAPHRGSPSTDTTTTSSAAP